MKRGVIAAALLASVLGCQQEQQPRPAVSLPAPSAPALGPDPLVRDLTSAGLDVRIRLPAQVDLKVVARGDEKNPLPPRAVGTLGKLELRLERLADAPTDQDLARQDGEWSVSSARTSTPGGWWLILEKTAPPALRLVEYQGQVLCTVDGIDSRTDLKDARKLCGGLVP
jgi:hypothetical protein